MQVAVSAAHLKLNVTGCCPPELLPELCNKMYPFSDPFVCPKDPGITLSPRIMEVENHPKWKETDIGGTHFTLPWLWEKGYTSIYNPMTWESDWDRRGGLDF